MIALLFTIGSEPTEVVLGSIHELNNAWTRDPRVAAADELCFLPEYVAVTPSHDSAKLSLPG